MSTLEVLCVQCACHQKTCCQETEIYVTPGDVNRIEQHIHRDDFFEFRAPTDPIYADQDDDPVWQQKVFRPDGTRRVLKHQANHDCTFLGEKGCVLPADVRPLICRLYPYDYTAAGLKTDPSEGCPRHLIANGQSVFEAVQIHSDDAQRWHSMLYQELSEEIG